jgi:hypothetical protein
MKRAAILIAVTVLVFAGCKPKADEVDKGGMQPAPAADMGTMEEVPAGDMGGMRPEPAGDDATSEFEKILAVEVLKLSIATLRKAVKLSPEKLKSYVAKNAAMNKANAEFGKKMVEMQKRIMKIKGAKKFLAEIQKDLAEKLKPLMKEMGELTKQYIKMTAAKGGTKDDMKPAPK